jgi:hypothetical protein
MMEKGEGKIRVLKTDDFVEKLAVAVIVGTTPEGFFVFDFLQPVAHLVAERDGKVIGYEGELRDSVRIYTSPIVAKRLLNALKEQIDKYESMFGEIKTEKE